MNESQQTPNNLSQTPSPYGGLAKGIVSGSANEDDKKDARAARLRIFAAVLLCIIIVLLGFKTFSSNNAPAQLVNKNAAGAVDSNNPDRTVIIQIPLSDLTQQGVVANSSNQFVLKNSAVFLPTSPPKNPQPGEVYYSQTTNFLNYFNGTRWVELTDQLANLTTIIQNSTATADYLAGTGINISGRRIANTGLLGSSGTPNQINVSTSNGTVNLSLPQDIHTNASPTFASLQLGTPLSVLYGGTGANNLASNGIVVGNGSGPLSVVTSGAAGQCLISTAGAPIFAACPGGGGGGSGSLQDAYDNSSTPATILSSSAGKNILLKSGAGFDSTNLFQVQDAAGSPVLTLDTINRHVITADLRPNVGGSLLGGLVSNNVASTNGGFYGQEQSRVSAIGADGFLQFVYYDNLYRVHHVHCENNDCTTKTDTTIFTPGGSAGVMQTSLSVGADGFARIAYGYANFPAPPEVYFTRCLDIACSSSVRTLVETINTGNSISDTSVIIGADGLARVLYSYRFGTLPHALKLSRCLDADCTTSNITTLSTGATSGYSGADQVFGPDGFLRIAYGTPFTPSSYVRYIQCNDDDCSSKSDTVVDTLAANDGSYYLALTLGNDGYGRISYIVTNNNTTLSKLKFANCLDDSCTTSNLKTIANTDIQATSIALGNDGFPRITFQRDVGLYALGELVYVQCNDNDCSIPDPTVIDSSSPMNSIPFQNNLTTSADGYAQVVYVEPVADEVKVARFSQGGTVTGTMIGMATSKFGQFHAAQTTTEKLVVSGNGGIAGRLGVGTLSPDATLDVQGHVIIQANPAYTDPTLAIKDANSEDFVNFRAINRSVEIFESTLTIYDGLQVITGNSTNIPLQIIGDASGTTSPRMMFSSSSNPVNNAVYIGKTTGPSFSIWNSAAGTPVVRFNYNTATNMLTFGDATTGGQVNIYRSAADILTTDDSLIVAANFTVNGNTTIGNAATDIMTINAEAAFASTTNISFGAQAVTFSAATGTLTPTSSYVILSCNRAAADTAVTLSEVGAQSGQLLTITIRGDANNAGTCSWADIAGVQQVGTITAFDDFDSKTFIYDNSTTSQWVQIAESNN